MTVVAKSFSRSVGTPMHSAASSLSRSAASPRPIQERSIDRATSTVTTARATITVKSSTPQLPKKGAGGRINVNPFAPPTYSQLMMSVCSTTESANVAIEKKTPLQAEREVPDAEPQERRDQPPGDDQHRQRSLERLDEEARGIRAEGEKRPGAEVHVAGVTAEDVPRGAAADVVQDAVPGEVAVRSG